MMIWKHLLLFVVGSVVGYGGCGVVFYAVHPGTFKGTHNSKVFWRYAILCVVALALWFFILLDVTQTPLFG